MRMRDGIMCVLGLGWGMPLMAQGSSLTLRVGVDGPPTRRVREAPGGDPLVIRLWEKGAPGFENLKDEKEHRNVQKSGEYNVTNVHNPSLTVFLPPKDKATGAAVILAPGGGHRELWVLHEGENEEKWLNDRGIAGFVLKYRLTRENDAPYQTCVHALQDGRRGV